MIEDIYPKDLIPTLDKLVISDAPYISVKEREDGERELIDLTRTADKEGIWLYFDSIPSFWCYIVISHLRIEGNETTGLRALGAVELGIDYGELGKLVERVTHYHIHPRCMEDESYDASIAKAEEETGRKIIQTPELERKTRNGIAALAMCVPSQGDILTYSDIIRNLKNCDIYFKIVSTYGILTVEFDPDRMSLDDVRQRYEGRLGESKLHKELWTKELSTKESIEFRINEINQYMNGGLRLSMKFNPREVA